MLTALALVALQQLPTPVSPAPSASPVPAIASPAPTPSPRFSVSIQGSNDFVDQATGGPGTTPPEANGFAHGSPLSPMSPYDWFSSAPVTPGVAGIAQYLVSGTYAFSSLTAEATLGIGGVTGSTTNAAYWGEPLVPNLDVHALSRVIPYSIQFPTHAGQDDATAGSASLVQASIGASDDAWRVRGGYFDLTQTDRFVFAPPPITSVVPASFVQTAETLGPGIPSIDGWPSSPSTLPLLGVDAVAKSGSDTLELSDALLPSLAGTSARLVMGSLVDDRGDDGRFSFQLANVSTGGAPIETTAFFGTQQRIYPGAQGRLYGSILGNQSQLIAGARAFFHPFPRWDALAELGRSWYGDEFAAEPGSARFGNYQHFSLARHLPGGDTAMLEYHRFDATYATEILPYGIPENVWSVAWSWPGVWLKSTYQLVDNSVIGANRAGFHFRYDHPGKPFEVHLSYGDWRQLTAETMANASQQGFVDGFFLLQRNGFGTIGTDHQVGLYLAYHFPHDDLALDTVEDFLYRPNDPGEAIDAVNTRAPQAVGSLTHHFSKTFLAVGGYGRYALDGLWATTPVDAIYGVGFAGVEFATGPKTALLIEGRRYALVGLPSAIGGPPPTMSGTGFVVDQRLSL
ncbi:MAG TPA: hypothetical protein VMF61_08855 [Candidatus Acidoferrales bacterium]|nr:hypothetical protein [Candidatus Acidoferrales bacterium]